MKNKPNIDLLQSVLHNSEIGVCAINYLMPSVKSSNLKKIMEGQRARMSEIADQAKVLGAKLDTTLKPNSGWKKSKLWLSTKTSAMMHKNTQHFAEMLLFGYFMGKIDLIKILAKCAKANSEIKELALQLKELEEQHSDDIFPFLSLKKR